MNCPNCGKEAIAGAKFCESCGAPLAAATASSAAPEPPASPYSATAANAQPEQPNAQAQPQNAAAYEPPAQTAGQTSNPYSANQNGYYQPNGAAQQTNYYQPPQGQQQYGYGQPASPYAQAGHQPGYAEAIYPMTETDRTLRLINFILCLISTIVCALAILPLCWMIPMTVISWGIYKGKKRNTVAFGVCTLIFVNLIGGVLLLCSHKDN